MLPVPTNGVSLIELLFCIPVANGYVDSTYIFNSRTYQIRET
jgi:hypothetical protein